MTHKWATFQSYFSKIPAETFQIWWCHNMGSFILRLFHQCFESSIRRVENSFWTICRITWNSTSLQSYYQWCRSCSFFFQFWQGLSSTSKRPWLFSEIMRRLNFAKFQNFHFWGKNIKMIHRLNYRIFSNSP